MVTVDSRLKVEPLTIPAIKSLMPKRWADARGHFAETFSRRDLAAAGIDFEGVQDNHALSIHRGTIRGLHFQRPPFAQAKIIRVVKGSIFDVAVDLRRRAPSYGHHVSVTLRAEEGHQLFVPVGFAHGYCTLEPDTEVTYKVDNYYSPAHEEGMLWNDPQLAIGWPLDEAEAVVSAKDRLLPGLAALDSPFH